MTRIAEALQAARRRIDAGEARLLLRHLLGRDAAWLSAHDDEILGAAQEHAFAALVERRAAGEPVAYLTGEREFYGRSFRVGPGVLIPRPDTELLVDLAKARLADLGAPRVLELGTGSGCIAVTLACELSSAVVVAVDNSSAALAIAAANAARHGVAVELVESDWFAQVRGRFDLIVANPPYIAAGDPHLTEGDLRFEPPGALASGSDGLAAIRRIVAAATAFLAPQGSLLLEHGYDQGAAVAALLAAAGFAALEQHRDLAGIVRASGGRRLST